MTTTRAGHHRKPTQATEQAAGTPSRSRRARFGAAALRELQRRAGNRASNELLRAAGHTTADGVASSSGADAASEAPVGNAGNQRLEPWLLSAMEQRFGTELPDVLVHADAHAAERAEDEQAVAFTEGADIYFGAGTYRPDTAEGRSLVAHELAHVIQQTRNEGPTDSSASLEAEAQTAASGPASPVCGSAPSGAAQCATKVVEKPAATPEPASQSPATASGKPATFDPSAQLYGSTQVGPGYASEADALAARHPTAHILEVIHTDKDGKVLGHWWEVSELGSGIHGHTEQKALVRTKLNPGDHLEMRGAYSPCSKHKDLGGCHGALDAVARDTGANITYDVGNSVREYGGYEGFRDEGVAWIKDAPKKTKKAGKATAGASPTAEGATPVKSVGAEPAPVIATSLAAVAEAPAAVHHPEAPKPPVKKTPDKRPVSGVAGPVAAVVPPPVKKRPGKRKPAVAVTVTPNVGETDLAQAVQKGLVAPIDEGAMEIQTERRASPRVREGGGTGGVMVHPETGSVAEGAAATVPSVAAEASPKTARALGGATSRGSPTRVGSPQVGTSRELPGMFTGKEVASLAEAGRHGAPTRGDRRLALAGKALGGVLQALDVADELTTAFAYVGMAENAMQGQGFILHEGIASARAVRDQGAATGEAYAAFRAQLSEGLGPGAALAEALGDPVQAALAAGQLGDQRFQLEALNSRIDATLPVLEEWAAMAKASKEALEAIYTDPAARFVWMLAQGKPSTAAIGELIAMAEDAHTIQGALEEACKQMRALQPLLADDLATIEPWEQAFGDVAHRGGVWRVPGTDIVLGRPKPPKR